MLQIFSLTERSQVGGLNETILGCTQYFSVLADHFLELFTAALAESGNAHPLFQEEGEENRGQPYSGGGKLSHANDSSIVASVIQCVQRPSFTDYRHGFPQ